ncbi:hypothetical protein Anamo_1367 [Acetomicrobium mobile DSM 13181]|uniref:Uncharacterized protein n=1 Tax=Acetomicrobium mobile (strain ATCC BAA-54 / DSM 13181 / JCM 12221 / NGA) TaxID=891968 RepID=I4BXG9_ACEMN|nr:hypothetical protein Anamo_1367 [Acetomicrobium mobile DSM 13181]
MRAFPLNNFYISFYYHITEGIMNCFLKDEALK